MDKKVDRRYHNTFHNLGNRNSIQDRYYGGDIGYYVLTMDPLYHDNRFQEDELSKKERIPCQNVEHACQQNQNGNEQVKPSINSKSNDFTNNRSTTGQKQINSHEENKNSTSTPMMHSECSERIQAISLSLGQLLQVDTLDGAVWIKKQPETPCRLVLPYHQYESISMCHMHDTVWYRRSHAMMVEVLKSNHYSIAASLGFEIFKIENKDQEDDLIGYIKDDLIDYIEEVRDFGFKHIIVIGEHYLGMLFMDCFGRVFDIDSMTDVLWFHGDYLKQMKRVEKGLGTTIRMGWTIESDGSIAKIEDGSNTLYYNLPVEKKKKKKRSKKKSSMKKHH